MHPTNQDLLWLAASQHPSSERGCDNLTRWAIMRVEFCPDAMKNEAEIWTSPGDWMLQGEQ